MPIKPAEADRKSTGKECRGRARESAGRADSAKRAGKRTGKSCALMLHNNPQIQKSDGCPLRDKFLSTRNEFEHLSITPVGGAGGFFGTGRRRGKGGNRGGEEWEQLCACVAQQPTNSENASCPIHDNIQKHHKLDHVSFSPVGGCFGAGRRQERGGTHAGKSVGEKRG